MTERSLHDALPMRLPRNHGALHERSKSPSPSLAQVLRVFAGMYRPHLARDDTVLFPAFRKLACRAHYRELGQNRDDRERALRGSQGFEETLAEVARLETALGIGDLAKLTPGT
jgi:hypothetical protein